MMKQVKIIIEKNADGHVAYPLGFHGVIFGQGDLYEAALADARSATRFHVETFGDEAFEMNPPVLEAFIAEDELTFGFDLDSEAREDLVQAKKDREAGRMDAYVELGAL